MFTCYIQIVAYLRCFYQAQPMKRAGAVQVCGMPFRNVERAYFIYIYIYTHTHIIHIIHTCVCIYIYIERENYVSIYLSIYIYIYIIICYVRNMIRRFRAPRAPARRRRAAGTRTWEQTIIHMLLLLLLLLMYIYIYIYIVITTIITTVTTIVITIIITITITIIITIWLLLLLVDLPVCPQPRYGRLLVVDSLEDEGGADKDGVRIYLYSYIYIYIYTNYINYRYIYICIEREIHIQGRAADLPLGFGPELPQVHCLQGCRKQTNQKAYNT